MTSSARSAPRSPRPSAPISPSGGCCARARQWVSRYPRLEHAYRIAVGILGGALTGLGLLLVPLPGPGWLVVFLGLAVLGTEFHWAKRIAVWLKRQLDRFWAWWKARRAQRAAASTTA